MEDLFEVVDSPPLAAGEGEETKDLSTLLKEIQEQEDKAKADAANPKDPAAPATDPADKADPASPDKPADPAAPVVGKFDVDDIDTPDASAFAAYNEVLKEVLGEEVTDPADLKEKISAKIAHELKEAANQPLQRLLGASQLTDDELIALDFKATSATSHYTDEKIQEEIEAMDENTRKAKATDMRSRIKSSIEQIRQNEADATKNAAATRAAHYQKVDDALKVYKDPDTGEELSPNVQRFISQEIRSGAINKLFNDNPAALVSAVLHNHPKLAAKFKGTVQEAYKLKLQSEAIKSKAPQPVTIDSSTTPSLKQSEEVVQYTFIR